MTSRHFEVLFKELEAEMECLQRDLDLKSQEVERLHRIIEYKDEKLKKMTLTYDELRNKLSLFKYMAELTVEQFYVMEMH